MVVVNSKWLIVSVIVGAWGLAACADMLSPTPLPPLKDPKMGAIGVSLKLRWSWPFVGQFFTGYWTKYTEIYFVRLEKDNDLPAEDKLIPSNYQDGDYIYLLNVEPGCYAAIFTRENRSSSKSGEAYWTTFFPRELIGLTKTCVAPGRFSFMGEYEIARLSYMDNADSYQLHYFHLVAEGEQRARDYFLDRFQNFPEGHRPIQNWYYRASLIEANRTPQSEERFFEMGSESHFSFVR